MDLSYWEIKSWLSNVDYTIVGSGIVGLNCALQLKRKYPKSNILVLEKGFLPQGASTKNAGFACFGSLSEILEDLKSLSELEVVNLIKKRYDGLKLLRHTLGDKNIGYQNFGGYEIFRNTDEDNYHYCLQERERINDILRPIFDSEVFSIKTNKFKFNNIQKNMLFNPFEGQIDTGKMMATLLSLVQGKGIKILNNIMVEAYEESSGRVHVKTNLFEFKTNKLLIATNGFSSKLMINKVKPARAQVVITKPIQNLHIKGTFHMYKGYYYFRNVDNRVLLGGGRNLDFETEETDEFGLTDLIQTQLERLIREIIIPNNYFEIEYRWSGIMGIGSNKKTIVKPIGHNVFCGVRLGGMGIAIGSQVGKELADLVD